MKKSCSTDDSVVVLTYNRQDVGQIGRFVQHIERQTDRQTDRQKDR